MPKTLLTVKVISPENLLFDGQASAVSLPGSEGPFVVLANHAPIISTLETGIIKIKDSREEYHNIEVKGGVARVLDNVVTVCVD